MLQLAHVGEVPRSELIARVTAVKVHCVLTRSLNCMRQSFINVTHWLIWNHRLSSQEKVKFINLSKRFGLLTDFKYELFYRYVCSTIFRYSSNMRRWGLYVIKKEQEKNSFILLIKILFIKKQYSMHFTFSLIS